VRELLEETAAPYRGFNVEIDINAAPSEGAGQNPDVFKLDL
jgi:hypothetical protein